MAARRNTINFVAFVRRRFFRTTLQPIAENMEYNPASIAARYRANYLGSVSLPSQQQASYSAAPTEKPTRDIGQTSNYDGETPDENTMPAVGSQEKQGGGKAAKGRHPDLAAYLRSPTGEPAFRTDRNLTAIGPTVEAIFPAFSRTR